MSRPNNSKNWLYDEYSQSSGLSFEIETVLFDQQTDYQNIKIVKVKDLGVALLLNNWIYRTEDCGSCMPEMIVHVPMNSGSHQKKKVLLIGGGDGYSLAELVKYKDIEQIDLVDIDKIVVEKCQEFFPVAKSAFTDHRVNIYYDDGANYLALKPDNYYDLILVTGTEILDIQGNPGISNSLFTSDFYQLCFQKLTNAGILLTDGQNGYYGGQFYKQNNQVIKNFFPIVKNYIVTSKYIPGGLYLITIATKNIDPETEVRTNNLIGLKYYNQKIHHSSFSLPNFLL